MDEQKHVSAFSNYTSKTFKYQISPKSVQWAFGFSVRMDGWKEHRRTDTTMLLVAFRNFTNTTNETVVLSWTVQIVGTDFGKTMERA